MKDKELMLVAIVFSLSFTLLFGSLLYTTFIESPRLQKTAYELGMNDLSDYLHKNGIDVNVHANPNGSYTISMMGNDGILRANLQYELHCITEHYRNGALISYENHAMSLTNLGKNWIADNLCGALLTNVSLIASYIGTSNQSAVFDAAWIVIPTEHLDGSTGLGRANSTYTDTGTGLFNLTHTFTAIGTYSTQTYGLYWDSYANDPNNGLIAAEVQASAKNMVASDTLAVTIMGTIS